MKPIKTKKSSLNKGGKESSDEKKMNEITGFNIREFLKELHFKIKDGEEQLTFSKKYENGYEIKIVINENNFPNSKIDYGKKIKVHRETTSNFLQQENFVILECVNRLLEKGYSPENIELEKVWNLGHKGKGFLDIWVKDKLNKSFLMIECKNWGTEYEKEKKNTLDKSKSGSQIFSYLQQEPKNTKAICLYTSRLENNQLDYKTSIIYNKEEWIELNQEERFSRWSETFEDNGIFEKWVEPYFLKTKSITRGQLKKLTKEDGENIYNKFAEILRHNVISDKSNAFNKIINLFLCKIYDEDRNEDEEVKFQIRTKNRLKEDEELLSDLSDLYKQGMINYLNKNIVDYTLEELQKKIKTKDETILLDVYRKLRLYKDNDFAFREVFDEKSFKDNAKVVREVVELLQDKQIRYSHKQQFLGDFFEKLLKDSIKQESGQFFTPVPITQFIIKSLPVLEMIKNKISDNEEKIIPYVIDYACGSGHFLTEIMDELNGIIKNIDEDKIQKPSLKKQIKSWKTDDFLWANEYIYGIDLDYRLVKTSKISCFLNGDGLAQVIHADGLDNFKSSEIYQGILKSKTDSRDNPKFDILISNPPYSVKAFRNTLNEGEKSFELYDNLTDTSSEIECLFVERAKQLLKDKGVIGIILPISILTNSGIYEKTREIIFKNFNIKAIVSFGSNAFMATGTKTIILFMEKKSEEEYTRISKLVNSFFETYKEVAINTIEKPISTYLKENYPDLGFIDYLSLLKNNPNEKIKGSEIFEEYKNFTNEEINLIEKEKILYFVLSYPQKIVVSDSGEKETEKEFYGYEFSGRRGYEGIHIYRDENGNIISKLYNQTNNKDTEKLNNYILKSFQNKDLDKEMREIDNSKNHPLKEHITFLRLSNLMNFNSWKFEKTVNLNLKKKRFEIGSKYNFVKLKEILQPLESGRRNNKVGSLKLKQGIPSLGGEHIGKNGEVILKNLKYVTNEFFQNYTSGKIKQNDILLCKDGALTGKLAIVKKDYPYRESMVNEHLFIIRGQKDKITQEFLFNFLYSSIGQSLLKQNIGGAGQGGLNTEGIYNIKIPLPPLEIQKKIIEEIDTINNKKEIVEKEIIGENNKIKDIIKNIENERMPEVKIEDICSEIIVGGTPQRKIREYYQNGKNLWVTITDMKKKYIEDTKEKITDKAIENSNAKLVPRGAVLVSIFATLGKVSILNKEATTNQAIAGLVPNKDKVNTEYLYYALRTKKKDIERLGRGIAQNNINSIILKNIKIPLPPLEIQKKIIEEIESIEKKIEQQDEFLKKSEMQKGEILNKYIQV